ncbi:fibronectin type III domain-containing protein [Paenibacillus amylolyticus]|nr:fibronectin type III domain-containing protein [Paenibacillus amylolyticus]WFR61479.1 fibronectin type III domain-containing protein [Paenibacillus amylolyticus]
MGRQVNSESGFTQIFDHRGDWSKNAPPSFTLTAPSSGQTYYKGEQLQISGTTKDTDVGDLLTVKWSIDGGTENILTQMIATGSNQSFNTNYTLPDTLPDGTHTLQVWVMDDKGGVSSAGTVNFTVRSFVVPGTPTYTLVNSNNLTVNWDKKANDASVTYELKNMTTNQIVDTGTTNSRQVTGLTPNTSYSFAVRAKNSSGSYTGYSSPASKYTLANPPAAAAVSQSGNSVTASWNNNSNPAGTQYKTEIRNPGGQVLATGTTTSTRTAFALTGLADGKYEVFVAALNGEGIQTPFISAGEMMKDTTGPTAPSVTLTPSSWTKEDVLVTVEEGKDALSGTSKTEVKVGPTEEWREYDAPFTVNSEGNTTVMARSIDAFGNTGQETSVTARVDRTAPTPPVISLNPPEWTKAAVIVTLTEGTDAASGIGLTQYKLGSEGEWSDYKTPFTLSEEGITEIYARSVDRAANVSASTSATARIDKTGPEQPTITLSEEDWTNQNVTFVITSGEDAGSGLAKSQYRLSEEGPWIDYTGEVKVTDEGETIIYARSLDRVGNISTYAQATARIDTTAPTEPVIRLSSAGWSKEHVEFTIAGSVDERAISYEYSLNDGPYVTGNTGTVSANGATTIRARARDSVGNVSKEVSRIAYVDQMAPTITFAPNGHDWTDTDMSTAIQYADAHSGIQELERFYQVTNSADSPDHWLEARSDEHKISIESEGIWYIHAKTMDRSGNTYETTSSPYHLQRKPEQPSRVRMSQISETSAELTVDLPTGERYTNGYQYEITNKTTGQSWTLDYPTHSIIDHSLSGGQVYEYEVRVRNHTGVSDAVSAQVLTIPAAPGTLHVRKVDSQPDLAEIQFDSVRGADGYRIIATTSDGVTVFDQTISDPDRLPYVSNLVPGTIHNISVTAMNESGSGGSSRTGFLTLPAMPGEFVAVEIQEHDISLKWETVTSATYYGLSRDGTAIYEGEQTEYLDSGLDSGTGYSYALIAGNETGPGPLAELPLLKTLPGQVSGLQVSDASTASLHLHWEAVRGADHYELWLNGEKTGTVPAGTQEWVFAGLSSGTSYQLEVQAMNGSGQGMRSTVSGTTLPESPSGLHVAQVTEQGAILSWEPVNGATKYRVIIDGQSHEISDTQLVVHQLSSSREYTYEVQAGNAAGYGASTRSTVLTLPSRPEGLNVTWTGETSMGLAWQAVDTANVYIVKINGTEVGRTSELTYTAEGLLPGTEYTLEVQATNTSGSGGTAQLIQLSKPVSPTEVLVDPGVHRANVSWSVVEGAAEYVIEQNGKEIYRGMENEAMITGLRDGTWHHYQLLAVNRQGTRSEVTDVSLLTLPEKPAKVAVYDVAKDSLGLDFSKTGVQGADHYIIERDGREIAQMDSSETQFVDKDLSPGTKYTYVIRAVNASGMSAPLTVSIMTQTLPVVAEDITVNAGTHAVDLAWDAVKRAVAYEIRNQLTGDVQTVSEPSVHFNSLLDGTAYEFELVAINEDGHRSESIQIQVLTKPASPQTAGITHMTDETAVLDLTGSFTRSAEQFIIMRDGVEVARIQTDQTSFEDHGLIPGEYYTYTIKTSNATGESDSGFEVYLRTLPATINEPLHASMIGEMEGVISWPKVLGAEGYTIRIGDQMFTTIEDGNITEVRLTHLESAARYDQVEIIPYNTAGSGSPMTVNPFYTLPHVDSLEMKIYPETDHAKLEWEFPYRNETFVVLLDGTEVYRGTQKEFIVDQLDAGKQYVIEIYTENDQGDASEKLAYAVLTKPAAPVNVEYQSAKDHIRLLFEQSRVEGAEQFIIERDGVEVARVPADELFYDDKELEPGVNYIYTVKTMNASGSSDGGYYLHAMTLPGSAASPPVIEGRSIHGADIVWELIPGAAGYRVYRNEELVGTTTETSLSVSELNSAERYADFVIIPFNDAGEGEALQVPEFETLPSGDLTVAAVAQGTNTIKLTWELDSMNEVIGIMYKDREIYRGTQRSYVWTGLNAEQHYELEIWTENSAGEKVKANGQQR